MRVTPRRRPVRVVSRPLRPLAFGPAAEAVFQRLVELAPQIRILGAQPRDLREQLTDHALQRGDVVGQRRIRGLSRSVHALSNPSAAAKYRARSLRAVPGA